MRRAPPSPKKPHVGGPGILRWVRCQTHENIFCGFGSSHVPFSMRDSKTIMNTHSIHVSLKWFKNTSHIISLYIYTNMIWLFFYVCNVCLPSTAYMHYMHCTDTDKSDTLIHSLYINHMYKIRYIHTADSRLSWAAFHQTCVKKSKRKRGIKQVCFSCDSGIIIICESQSQS